MNMRLTDKMLEYALNDKYKLLINTISGAIDIVDKESKEKIDQFRKGDFHSAGENDELLKALADRGYLYDSKEAEEACIENYIKINKKLFDMRKKINFTICPTMGCNLRCPYCFEGDDNHRNMELMTDGQLQSIFRYIEKSISDYARSCKENEKKPEYIQRPAISLFGGEPLLPCNYDIVSKIINFAKAHDMEVKIITNGTNIKQYSELLQSYPYITVQVTVDGAKPIHDKRRIKADKSGTFDIICENIDELIRLKVKTSLRANIDRENIDTLNELIDVVKEKKWVESGYITPYVSPVLDFSKDNDMVLKESELYSSILQLVPDYGQDSSPIKNIVSPVISYLSAFLKMDGKMKPWKMHYCEATSGESLIFSPDGQITTCLLLTGKGKSTIGKFDEKGVYIDEDLSKVWFERTIFRIPKCKKCKYALLCGGGCPVAAIDVNNSIDCAVCSDIEKTLEVFVESKKDMFLEQIGE